MQRKIFSFLSVLVMIAIFIFSSQGKETTYSLSSSVTNSVNCAANKLTSVTDSQNTGFYQQYLKKYLNEYNVRKGAHILLYTLLSFCLSGFFYKTGCIKNIFLSAVVSVIYAATDEFHQYFVEGRGASSKDVLIDFIGIIAGIILFALSCFFLNKLAKRAKAFKKNFKNNPSQ